MIKISRRNFVKTSAVIGGATIIGSQFPGILKAGIPEDVPDIVTISADDPLTSIPQLTESLGGVDRFIKSGDTVGILVNSPWKHPGTYTSPDVALSVANFCLESGASKVVCFKPVREGYWEESQYFDQMKKQIETITYCNERITVDIPDGTDLKEAEIFKDFLDVDVYISIPVAKHHTGTIFSGNLKGLMGVSSSNTNRHMHSPDGEYTYSKHDYLAQCIADLNLIRQPDLCIVDAIECVLENGPRGPGETTKPNKIIAGTDPVALDVYSASLMGLDPDDILTVHKAHQHGLGEVDIDKLKIVEI